MSKIFIGDYVISNKSIKNIYNNYITSYKNYPRDFNSIIINENEILFGKVVNISKGIFLVKYTKLLKSETPTTYKDFKNISIKFDETVNISEECFNKWIIPHMTKEDETIRFIEIENIIEYLTNENSRLINLLIDLEEKLDRKIYDDKKSIEYANARRKEEREMKKYHAEAMDRVNNARAAGSSQPYNYYHKRDVSIGSY